LSDDIEAKTYYQGQMIPKTLYQHIKSDLCVFDVGDALALGAEVLGPFLSTHHQRLEGTAARFWVCCPGFAGSVPVRDDAGEVRGTFARCTDLPTGEGEILEIAVADLPFPTVSESELITGDEDCLECADPLETCEHSVSEESAEPPAAVAAAAEPEPVDESPRSVIEGILADYPYLAEVPTGVPIVEDPAMAVPPLMRFDVIERTGAADLVKWMEIISHDVPGITLPEGLDQMGLEEVREVARQVSVCPAAYKYQLAEEERKARVAHKARYDQFQIIDEKGGVRIDHKEVGRYIRDRLHAITYRRTLYVYDEETGLYHEEVGEVGALVQEIAEAVGYSKTITHAKREVMSYVKDHHIVHEYPFNLFPGIPLANGVLVIDYDAGTKDLRSYTPEMRFTFRLPVAYDSSADPAPIHEALQSWVAPEDLPVLYQIPAQAVLHITGLQKPFKKMYILQGDGNAGKTTYIELLRGIFGATNCSGIALQRIGPDRFSRGAMEGKLLNVYDDLSSVPFSNAGELKTLTGAFEHDIEKKGRDSYQGRIFCIFLFTANKPPAFADEVREDSAFWERWQYVVFQNSFVVDPTFRERMFTPANLSGILNIVIDVAIRIRQQRRLLVDADAYEVRERWTKNSDPLYRFIQEHLVKQEKRYIRKDDLYDAVCRYWQTERLDPATMPATKEILSKRLFGYGFTDERRRVDGEQVRYYGGYDWVIGSPYRTKVVQDD